MEIRWVEIARSRMSASIRTNVPAAMTFALAKGKGALAKAPVRLDRSGSFLHKRATLI
jgi:hypothetical protein